MPDIDAITKANDLRRRIQAGEEVPPEELAAVYEAMRSDRVKASETASKGKRKTEEVPSNLPTDLKSLF